MCLLSDGREMLLYPQHQLLHDFQGLFVEHSSIEVSFIPVNS